ncbi:MAG: hypothetical protein HOW73_09620 [Polyangiaceae bacterium]|nr:hypothetical protein [Polyangiaceae bacterium]
MTRCSDRAAADDSDKDPSSLDNWIIVKRTPPMEEPRESDEEPMRRADSTEPNGTPTPARDRRDADTPEPAMPSALLRSTHTQPVFVRGVGHRNGAPSRLPPPPPPRRGRITLPPPDEQAPTLPPPRSSSMLPVPYVVSATPVSDVDKPSTPPAAPKARSRTFPFVGTALLSAAAGAVAVWAMGGFGAGLRAPAMQAVRAETTAEQVAATSAPVERVEASARVESPTTGGPGAALPVEAAPSTVMVTEAAAAPMTAAASTPAVPPTTAEPIATSAATQALGAPPVASSAPVEGSAAADASAPAVPADTPTEQTLAEFDKAAAQAALSAASGTAMGCASPEERGFDAHVSVTFAPSGRVTQAMVSGPPFAGAPSGACIARAFKAASVSPFTGAPVTVSKTLKVR